MLPNPLFLFLAGGAFLIGGAELLVRGASRLAVTAGISPLVVGLTVVAFGTSAPELAVTVGSAWGGNADVALGNVVGSNIFNVLFILGLSAMVSPLVVSARLVRLDVPLMIGASILVLLLALDGGVGRWDGILLFAIVLAYTVFLIWQSRGEHGKTTVAEPVETVGEGASGGGGWPLNAAFILVGLALLVLGARWLVRGAVTTAEALGVSQLVIGLTIVAAGTSLPEVATSVLASFRGQRDIAVGNVVGSNIFNLLAVLGLGAIVAPAGVPVSTGALTFDLPVMTGVAMATLPIFFTGWGIARWEGAVFLGFYGAYATYLVMSATGHQGADELGTAMIWFILPLTVLTLAVLTLRALRQRPGAREAGPES